MGRFAIAALSSSSPGGCLLARWASRLQRPAAPLAIGTTPAAVLLLLLLARGQQPANFARRRRLRRRHPLLPHVVECDLVLKEFLVCSSAATLPHVAHHDFRATAPLHPRLVLPLDRHGKVIREISPQIATMARLPHGHASGRHGSGASFARSRVVLRQHGKRLNRSRPRERRRRQRRRRRIVEDGGSRRLL